MEIGVDCIEIDRFLKLEGDAQFVSKIYSGKEIEYCSKQSKPSQHYAARFAGKEAVIKALSHYGIQLLPSQIEILNEPSGIPYVNILTEQSHQFSIKISLSHSDDTAIAFAIIYPKEYSRC